ncbi:DUF2268 domain-containing protein [Halobacillus sp. BBL2006]|uniref:DUF2268 domain-containing protein n=1 Tax=Halobacillus sp. BBL2006 TaxID=1543706 RepID=UPI0005424F1B|nr:DUF2268 domain-containing putative Zn-dependent protease [Halobacillus sp. BBL2006]KHE71500.1 hypothetical protein LD39_09480 [Halobacillus sp. BBL2006]
MSVIKTEPLLYDFIELCKKDPCSLPQWFMNQCKALCRPVKEIPDEMSPEELQYLLLNHGLFDPGEWENLHDKVLELERIDFWKVAEQEYHRLKAEWGGPEASVYIFPVRKFHLPADERDMNKSGVSLKKCLFLFVAPDIQLSEMKALLAHEYNHICRLSHLNLDERELPLKESIIMEGLAEYAVKHLYGKKLLAPWNFQTDNENGQEIFEKYYLPSLNLKGMHNHHQFLYGGEGTPIPKWGGYKIGFQIVAAYLEKQGSCPIQELLTKTADEIISGAGFPIN